MQKTSPTLTTPVLGATVGVLEGIQCWGWNLALCAQPTVLPVAPD